MKKLVFILMIILLLNCKSEKKYSAPSTLTKDNISGKSLWGFLTKKNNYKNFSMWPNFEGLQIGQSPHGRYHIIYIDPVLRNYLPIKDKKAPYGSIIVKENLDANKDLAAITVMIKIKDFDPENSDWFWAKYDKNGKIAAQGKVNLCISCHNGRKSNDYIIVHPLDMDISKKEK